MPNKATVFHLATGPAIEIDFSVKNDIIQEVSLHPSSTQGLKWNLKASQRLQDQVYNWMQVYSRKQPSNVVLPLNWTQISPFTRQVLHILETIPFGCSLSYKQVAQLLHQDKAYRAVGNACGRNPFLFIIPCHRILASQQGLGGFAAGIEIKQRLLDFENIPYHT